MEDFAREQSKYIVDNIANAMEGFVMTSEYSLKKIPKNIDHLMLTQYCDQKYPIPILDLRSCQFSQLMRITFCGQCLQNCHTVIISGRLERREIITKTILQMIAYCHSVGLMIV